MGKLVNLKCEKCGYETNLGLGAGYLFFDLEVVLSLFDKETQEKIKMAVEQNPGATWSASKEIGICDRCGKISAIGVFTLTDPSGKEITIKAKCPCGAEVDIKKTEDVLKGKTDISCPACGDVLKATVNGHWD